MAFRLAPVAGDRVYGLLSIKLASLVVEGTYGCGLALNSPR
jgi:hypothetical protein